MNRNSILVGLVIFYTIFLGLLGLWNPAGISTSEESASSNAFVSWLSSQDGFVGDFTDFLTTIFTNLSGFPTILNVVFFTPMGIMALWLLIDLIIYITPFIGGGS